MGYTLRISGLGLLALAVVAGTSEMTMARGRGGGRVGGGASRGGGISRPSPSMGRPATSRPPVGFPSQRPSVGVPSGRPNVGIPSGRPNVGIPSGRPNVGIPSGRPNVGIPSGRPNVGIPSGRPGVGVPSGRPGVGLPGAGPGGRPTQGQLNDFLNLDRPGGSRPGGGAAGDFLQNRPGRPTTLPAPGERPGGRPPGVGRPPGDRPQFPGHQPGLRPPNYRPPGYRPPGQRPPGWRPPGYRPPVHLPHYGPGYWGRYPAWRWHWHTHRHNWWAWATAGAVTGWWVGFNQQPVYYDYGGNTYYDSGNVYQDGEVIATAEEYAEQAQTIATNVPEDADPDKIEWLPLGVFALTEKEGSASDATLFLQLAISKEGIIAGTFRNTATDRTVEVEGTIDQKSQRAAWGPVGEKWPIMETGVFNLTENEAGALLHFENGQTQQWLLTRLDEPENADAAP